MGHHDRQAQPLRQGSSFGRAPLLSFVLMQRPAFNIGLKDDIHRPKTFENKFRN
ncbi:unnamed protein product [Schistosoma mattheei]|uniref:Uncharacterized protein n=1 Tax=Schistosoma mattheei TaxID=31246 RepID=A0A3P8F294_9TREM|nr:unnamed protein product [Schistosoma mattheei]